MFILVSESLELFPFSLSLIDFTKSLLMRVTNDNDNESLNG